MTGFAELRKTEKAETRSSSRVEAAYGALKEAILTSVFPPGYQGSEQEIAVRLGMSRTPVHAALIRLQEDGLVRILAKRGVVVCAVSPDDIRDIYDVIRAVEPMAAELLAAQPKASRRAVADELDRLNVAMKQSLARGDLVRWAKSDNEFHRLLSEACGNGRITRIARTVMDQAHRARMLTLTLRAKPIRSVREHRAIIAAIRKGNAQDAHDCARAHRTRARNELVPLLARFGIRHL